MRKDVTPQTFPITTWVDKDLLERIDRLAKADKRKRSQMARVLLEEAAEAREQSLDLEPAAPLQTS